MERRSLSRLGKVLPLNLPALNLRRVKYETALRCCLDQHRRTQLYTLDLYVAHISVIMRTCCAACKLGAHQCTIGKNDCQDVFVAMAVMCWCVGVGVGVLQAPFCRKAFVSNGSGLDHANTCPSAWYSRQYFATGVHACRQCVSCHHVVGVCSHPTCCILRLGSSSNKNTV